MPRKFVLLITLLLLIAPAWAQEDDPPDYRVKILGYKISEDDESLIIRFGVYNTGGNAESASIVQLRDISSSEEIARTRVRALDGDGDSQSDLELRVDVREFEPGSQHTLEIVVGIGDIEPEDSDTILNNIDSINVEIPEYEEVPNAQQANDGVFSVPLLDIEVDTTDTIQMLILAGIMITGLVMLILLVVILRLVFSGQPSFGNWQPSYATIPPLDPNSTYGRRQLWQQHAQNNVVPMPCRPGSYHARKILMGMDGRYLSGWRVIAMRMTQYDMYGRVSRTQILAPSKLVARLNRVIRRSNQLNEEQLRKRVRPVAKGLIRSFKKKLIRRSMMLPVALDIRLEGRHGDVRIMFDLHECQNDQPVQLDYWEPEMMVVGKRINESYTFTIFGQRTGEGVSAFHNRLTVDIESVLADFLRTAVTTTTATPEEDPPSGENQPTDKTNPGEAVVSDDAL